MITINNDLVNETQATLWYDDKTNPPVEIGVIKNAIALNDVRLQIAKERVCDYYIIFNNKKIRIDKYGGLELWPIGLFTLMDEQLDELLGIVLL